MFTVVILRYVSLHILLSGYLGNETEPSLTHLLRAHKKIERLLCLV